MSARLGGGPSSATFSDHGRRAAYRLEIGGGEAGPLGDALEHLGADFVAVVESEKKVRPARPFQDAVGAGAPALLPANAQKSGQDAPGLGGAPVHAAVKRMVSRSSRSEAAI